MVYGYKNINGGISYLGASDTQERLLKALNMANISTEGIEFTDVEPVQIDGKYYLSTDDVEYQRLKVEQDNQQNIIDIDTQYQRDKETLIGYYTEAVMREDTALQADIKAELTALDTRYDTDIQSLMEV